MKTCFYQETFTMERITSVHVPVAIFRLGIAPSSQNSMPCNLHVLGCEVSHGCCTPVRNRALSFPCRCCSLKYSNLGRNSFGTGAILTYRLSFRAELLELSCQLIRITSTRSYSKYVPPSTCSQQASDFDRAYATLFHVNPQQPNWNEMC